MKINATVFNPSDLVQVSEILDYKINHNLWYCQIYLMIITDNVLKSPTYTQIRPIPSHISRVQVQPTDYSCLMGEIHTMLMLPANFQNFAR